jgi:hypothetical protein
VPFAASVEMTLTMILILMAGLKVMRKAKHHKNKRQLGEEELKMKKLD